MDVISANSISFRYKSELKVDKIWKNINFSIKSGTITSILGVSGVGKTTILRILTGLCMPDQGQVLLNGIHSIAQPESPIFLVFQDYNSTILPWLKVRDNILLGDYKSGHKTSKKELNEVVALLFKEYSHDVDILLNKYPQKLSGGQRQRIQIARALVSKARFILFDEPDSGVDIHTKIEIRNILRDLARNNNIGIVIVSHDLDNAVEISDQILVLVEKGFYEYHKSIYFNKDLQDPYGEIKAVLLNHFKNN